MDGIQHLDLAELDAGITGHFLAGMLEELRRRSSIPGEIAVQTSRPDVSGLADVADQRLAAAASQHERGTQPCGPRPDDDAVVCQPGRVGTHQAVGTAASITCLNRRRSSSTCVEGSSPRSLATAAPNFPAGG